LHDFWLGSGTRVTVIGPALPTDESRELLIPGERGTRTHHERTASGVPLSAKLWTNLTDQASAAGLPVPAG
jgi:LDH2 family malate/lactate/ureidoglycolate dehydrogenase